MARITFSKFSKNYGLLLLPYSASTYKIGYKAEWKGRVRRRFQIENNYFFNYFPFSVPQIDKLLKGFEKLNKKAPVEANFAGLDLNNSTEISAGLGTVALGKIVNTGIAQRGLLNFSFDGVSSRILDGHDYNNALQGLVSLQASKGKFSARENKLMFIEQLFYAERVRLNVTKSVGAILKAKIKLVDVESVIERESQMEISFSNRNSPFAVKLKTIKDLMD